MGTIKSSDKNLSIKKNKTCIYTILFTGHEWRSRNEFMTGSKRKEATQEETDWGIKCWQERWHIRTEKLEGSSGIPKYGTTDGNGVDSMSGIIIKAKLWLTCLLLYFCWVLYREHSWEVKREATYFLYYAMGPMFLLWKLLRKGSSFLPIII